jgi:hypothetical protein
MVWKKAAQGYMESFARVRSDRLEIPRVQFSARVTTKTFNQLPGLNLDHVNALTDDTGMIQHAIFTIPNRAEGYATDDNARALIFTVLLEQLNNEQPGLDTINKTESVNPDWAFRYLAFLEHAFNPKKSGSATFSVLTVAGWKNRARRTLTDAPYGLWEPYWAGQRITDFEELQDECSSIPCPQ